MKENVLTPEQIQNWRKIIAIHLNEKALKMGVNPDVGVVAYIMPESEVIEYYKLIKSIVENPKNYDTDTKPIQIKEKCNHSNSFTGQYGRYCIDCEKYV